MKQDEEISFAAYTVTTFIPGVTIIQYGLNSSITIIVSAIAFGISYNTYIYKTPTRTFPPLWIFPLTTLFTALLPQLRVDEDVAVTLGASFFLLLLITMEAQKTLITEIRAAKALLLSTIAAYLAGIAILGKLTPATAFIAMGPVIETLLILTLATHGLATTAISAITLAFTLLLPAHTLTVQRHIVLLAYTILIVIMKSIRANTPSIVMKIAILDQYLRLLITTLVFQRIEIGGLL